MSSSPFKLALGISLAIATGSILTTLDSPIFNEITSGRFLIRPFIETQARNTAAIASIDDRVGALTKDLDFISSRVSASVRRNEDQTFDRLAHLDAEIAALKERMAVMQTARLSPRTEPAPAPAPSNEQVSGLRSSLNELSSSHQGAVSAITRRLDRLEVMIGMSTDTASSAADPEERQRVRRESLVKAKKVKPAVEQTSAAPVAGQTGVRPERGHIFNMKPISQQPTPLRVSSRLPS